MTAIEQKKMAKKLLTLYTGLEVPYLFVKIFLNPAARARARARVPSRRRISGHYERNALI
jgi:hypothetical protein